MKKLIVFAILLVVLCTQAFASAAIIATMVASSAAASNNARMMAEQEKEADQVKLMCKPPTSFAEANNCKLDYANPREPFNFYCTIDAGHRYVLTAGCDGSVINNRIETSEVFSSTFWVIIGGLFLMLFVFLAIKAFF